MFCFSLRFKYAVYTVKDLSRGGASSIIYVAPSGEVGTQTLQFDKHFASIRVCLPLKLANSSNKKRTRLLVIFLQLSHFLFSLLFSDTRATHLSIHMASSVGRRRRSTGRCGGGVQLRQKIEFCSGWRVSLFCARPSGNLNNSRILPKGTGAGTLPLPPSPLEHSTNP